MATVPVANTFEGGTDGVTISAANSGGASGDAFTSVFGTSLFQNSPAIGGMAMEVVDAAGSTGVRWTGFGLGSVSVYFRGYYYLTAFPTTNALIPMFVQTAAAASCAQLQLTTAGKLRNLNAAAGPLGTAGAVSVALNQWIRIEWRVLASTTVGEAEWRLFNTADSTTADETQNNTGAVLGADTDGIRFGVCTTPVPTTPFTVGVDNVAASSTDWIGPVPSGFTNTVVPTVTGTLNVGGTLTANTGTWTPTPGSFNYYWHRADDVSAINLVEIGATGATYTLSSSDLNKYIRAGVIPNQ
jgi:hypothetical protein